MKARKTASAVSPPLDLRDLVVYYETQGITAAVARGSHGFADHWEMAAARLSVDRVPVQEEASTRVSGLRIWIEYLRGVSFALPLLGSSVAMLYLHFSLWGGNFSASVAEAVAIGTVSSFVASGGFVQAMSRRGQFFAGIREFRACAQSTWGWLFGGVLWLAITALAELAGNAYYNWLPWSLNSLALAFHISLGLFWLATGILYMLDHNLLVAAITGIGIGSVIFLHRVFSLETLISQILSILVAAALAITMAAFLLRRKIPDGPNRLPPQSMGRLFCLIWPYFAYGLLYYLFLFSDRLIAWTARTDTGYLLVQFRGDYETAIDLALFAFIIQVGWVRASTVSFVDRLILAERSFTPDRIVELNRSVLRFFRTRILGFLLLAIVSSVAVYLFAISSVREPIVHKVLIWSLAGYAFLVMALWNVSLLFLLSRPGLVLKAIGIATLVNVAAGYLLSRVGSYEQSVIGFALGDIVFMCLSAYYVVTVLRRVDYYYFASAV
jgi:hypothetical protein